MILIIHFSLFFLILKWLFWLQGYKALHKALIYKAYSLVTTHKNSLQGGYKVLQDPLKLVGKTRRLQAATL
jgi:hypothetical protein